MKKILVIEDDKDLVKIWMVLVGRKLEVLVARSVSGAEKLFKKHSDIALIIFDGHVLQDDNSSAPGALTLDLIMKLRKVFEGPMIATSRDQDIRKQQMERGCNYQSDKTEITTILRKLSFL